MSGTDDAPTSDAPRAPSHLSPAATRVWARVVATFEMEPTELEILRLALEARDRAAQARRVLKREGLTFLDRWDQPRPRPEAQIEAQAADRYARLMKQLGLAPVVDDDDDALPKIDRRTSAGRRMAAERAHLRAVEGAS